MFLWRSFTVYFKGEATSSKLVKRQIQPGAALVLEAKQWPAFLSLSNYHINKFMEDFYCFT